MKVGNCHLQGWTRGHLNFMNKPIISPEFREFKDMYNYVQPKILHIQLSHRKETDSLYFSNDAIAAHPGCMGGKKL